MNKIICDKCKKPLVVSKAYKERTIGKNVVEKYLKCHSCGAEYTILLIDDYVRDKMKEIKELSINGNIHDLSERLDRIKAIQEDARAHSKELELIYKRDSKA